MLKRIGFFGAPALFIILLLIGHPESISPGAWKAIAGAVWMLIWWVTEAVPMPVTSLLPLALFPLLGLGSIKDNAVPYSNPVVFLFMGGFMIALALEKWNLHRRIALTIVRWTGTNANGIILGFMLATALLSMWISNTATTVMMLPIANSVIQLLTQSAGELPRQGIRNFALCMMLAIAYSASIGGTATIIGTPPNSVMTGFISENLNMEVGFARWMIVGVPFSFLLIFAAYFLLVKVLYPSQLGSFQGAQAVLDLELKKLGPISKTEKRVLAVFLFAAVCWIFQSYFNALLKETGFVLSDTVVAMAAGILLFMVPSNFEKHEFLLDWEDTMRLPWGILLLFGGGLSLADTLYQQGIIDIIGQQFAGSSASPLLVTLGLTAASLMLTEVMSNVALVTVFLPVVYGVANGLGMEPLFLIIPVTLAASCAFMLPMSTPPNAIVFASNYVTIPQMARAGFFLNIIAILLAVIAGMVLAPWAFG